MQFMHDMELLDIPIAQIQLSDLIPMRKVNTSYVQELIESNSVDKLPPLLVFKLHDKDNFYTLVGGQHRLEVLHHLGHTSVKAFLLKTNDPRNAFIASIKDNNSHGLRFSNTDKKNFALFLHNQKFSIASIADIFQVDRSTVHRWIFPSDKPSVDSDFTSRKLIKNVFKSILTLRRDIFLDDDIEQASKSDIDYFNDLLTQELSELKNNDEKAFVEILSILIHFVKRSKVVADL